MPTLTATISITPIANMLASVPFQVSGTYQLSQSTWTDTLIYEDDHGTNVAIASPPVPLTQSNWSFTHQALPPGTHTVSVKDPLTGSVATSNSFTVGVAQTMTANTPTGAVAGTAFTFTGSLLNFTTAPTLTYSLSGGPPTSLGGVTNTGWSASITIAVAGTYTIIVSSGAVSSNTVTFTVAPATVNHTITLDPLNGGAVITAGATVSFSGSLTGYATVPSLTYTINNSQPVVMTGVTVTGWSLTIPAPATAGAYVINVSDGTTQNSENFSVSPAAKVITPNAPTGAVAGQSFTFTGSLSGYTTIPALAYTLNGGTPVTMTGISVSGWAMTITIATSGTDTISVTDIAAGATGTVTFSVAAAPPPTSLRNWYQNPGMDGSFWVQPFYSSAQWITSGALVTALRNGSHGTPTGTVNLKDNYSVPWVIGTASDPIVTVTDTNGTHTIHVHMPLGTIIETPTSAFDQSIGGADTTQPYLIWSISGATMNTGSVQASGSVITGTYGFAVQDGSGLIMVDAVTGAPGDNNSIGNIQDYELGLLNADPNFVIPHMLAFQLDVNSQCSGLGPVWPLKLIDLSGANTGPIPQGITIGIPASVKRPTGQTRGFYAWFDVLQQFGAFEYNDGGTTATNFMIYSTNSANAALVTDMVNSISAVMAYVCILNYSLDGVTTPLGNSLAGAQYSLATTKGFVPGATAAFPAPPPIDLSPTGGVNVAPSTFGAWYPSGYNAIPTNTTTTPTFTISPNAPTNAVVNTAFTFTGSLTGYTTAPTLTYSVDGSAATALGGVTSTGWSTTLTIATSGAHTIVITDAVHVASGSTNFNVSTGTTPPVTSVTWNPSAVAGGVTLSNSNATATASGSATPYAAPQGVLAATAINATQTVLWEVKFTSITQNSAAGIANTSAGLSTTGGLGVDTNSIGYYPSTGSGSQPAQTVYYNAAQLTSGNGVTSVGGEILTFVAHGSSVFISDSAMRSTSGVSWNNSTTANPITNVGGFSFSGVGATYYPVFATGEGGSVAVLNDGTQPLSAFATAFLNANSSVVTISGQASTAVRSVSPATPVGVVAGTPFSFTGSLTGYTTAPTLTYSINGGSSSPLSGVTANGWSTTLTIAATGTDTITVTDGTTSGATGSFTVSATAGTTPAVSVSLTSPTGQTVPNTIYGFGTGAFADNGFANTAVTNLANSFQSLAPSLFRVNMNANVNGQQWQDAVFASGGPFWQYFDPMITNSGGAAPQVLPTLVSHTSIAAIGTATTPAINTTGANLLVIIQSQYAQSPIATISDSKGNTWTPLTPAVGITAYVRISYVFNPIVGTGHTFTKTVSGNDFGTMLVQSFAAAGTFSGTLTTLASVSSSTSLSAGPITPAGNGSLIVSGASIIDPSSGPYNIDSSLIKTDSTVALNANFEGGAAAYLVQGTAATITPTWSWTGSVTAAVATAIFGISGSSGGVPQPPQQARNAGFTNLVFNDDFTTTTSIAPTANSTAAGFNWYWQTPQIASLAANANVNTTFVPGVSDGKPTAAGGASKGIVTINQAVNNFNGGLITVPQANLSSYVNAWQHGYFEAYIQFNVNGTSTNNSNGWPSFWSYDTRALKNPAVGSIIAECDFMEQFFGGNYASTMHNWMVTSSGTSGSDQANTNNANNDVSLQPKDSGWHKYGMLWTGNGTTGTVQFYYDDQLVTMQNGQSSFQVGPGTNSPTSGLTAMEAAHMYIILGTGNGWPMNVDWVRVWQV